MSTSFSLHRKEFRKDKILYDPGFFLQHASDADSGRASIAWRDFD